MSKISQLPDVGFNLSPDDLFPIVTPNDLNDANKKISAKNLTTFTSSGLVKLSDSGVVTSAMIANDTIVNNDINDSAEIAYTKLASTAAGNILLANSSGVITGSPVSGDATITSAGIIAISPGVIVDADVNNSAAINGSKILPNFGSQNITTSGDISAASFSPVGSTVPVIGLFRPAANAIGEATNSLERRRTTANGISLIGQTTEPTGAIAGSIAAQALYLGGGTNYGINQRHSGALVSGVTASTGEVNFNFVTNAASAQPHSAFVTLKIICTTVNNTPSNTPVAEYSFVLHQTTAGVITLQNQQSKYQYTFDIATHFSFATASSTTCTVTLTNPVALAIAASTPYEVTILSRNGRFGLSSVTTT
jgi:hypothetical protein